MQFLTHCPEFLSFQHILYMRLWGNRYFHILLIRMQNFTTLWSEIWQYLSKPCIYFFFDLLIQLLGVNSEDNMGKNMNPVYWTIFSNSKGLDARLEVVI